MQRMFSDPECLANSLCGIKDVKVSNVAVPPATTAAWFYKGAISL